MPQTCIGSSWYDEEEAARAFELDRDTVHAFYQRIIAEGREPISYYKGPGIPLLSGYTLRQLLGQRQPPQYRPTTRRTRRRR